MNQEKVAILIDFRSFFRRYILERCTSETFLAFLAPSVTIQPRTDYPTFGDGVRAGWYVCSGGGGWESGWECICVCMEVGGWGGGSSVSFRYTFRSSRETCFS